MRITDLLMLAVIATAGCVNKPPVEDGTTGELPEDPANTNAFYCGLRPSQAYGPGYLYRIDENQADLLVRDLGDQVKVNYYTEALGAQEATVTRSGGLTVSLLKPFKDVSGNIGPSGSSVKTTKVSFTDGRSARMTDDDAKAMLNLAEKQFTREAGSKYYIVRDAIQAKGIQITLSKEDEVKLGGEAGISNLIMVTPNFTYKRDESFKIDGKFPVELNVCIRIVEIVPVTGEQSLSPDGKIGPSIEWSGEYAGADVAQKIFNIPR